MIVGLLSRVCSSFLIFLFFLSLTLNFFLFFKTDFLKIFYFIFIFMYIDILPWVLGPLKLELGASVSCHVSARI